MHVAKHLDAIDTSGPGFVGAIRQALDEEMARDIAQELAQDLGRSDLDRSRLLDTAGIVAKVRQFQPPA